jgi:hypothetical protein
VLTLKQAFEVLTGQRGNEDYRAVLLPELTASDNADDAAIAANAAAIAALDAAKVAKAGDVMTGQLTTANSQSIAYGGSVGSIEVRSTGTGDAAMSFHRPGGGFACNFGLGSDHNFYFGGWSHGAAAYKLWSTRDFNYTPVNKAGDTLTGTLGAPHIVSVGGYVWSQTSASTGYYMFGTSGGKYLNYDGSNFVFTGGGLYASGIYSYTSLNATGLITSAYGYSCRSGIAGIHSNVFNFFWNNTANEQWIDSTYTGTVNTTSDYRIKKDITDAQPMLNEVRQWRVISYTGADWGIFKANEDVRHSFIAHELQAISPDCVYGEKDGEQPQSLDTIPIIARLAKAVQELLARIEALEAR